MFKDSTGKIILEIDTRLNKISLPEKELKVTQEELYQAIKAYRLNEALELFSIISKKVFNKEYPSEYHSMGRAGVRHPSGVFITQFAIEYLASAFILSGSNDWKKESVKNKDNILGLLNIYQSCLISNTNIKDITSFLVPLSFQQFVTQNDPKKVFTRQWYIFYKINEKYDGTSFDNLNEIFLRETALTILEYTKLSFVIFAVIISNPHFNIGKLTGATIPGLVDVTSEEKVSKFLKLIGADYREFRQIDSDMNKNIDPIFTKNRFNPLWIKPIIKLGENNYLSPCISTYITSTFRGLFWWFDTYFKKESRKKADDFRSYFGNILFERYAGDVIKDIFGESNVSPQIPYGTKKNSGLFFDWIVKLENKVYLFETKGYQFPIEVLQTGNPEKIRNEVTNKIVYAVKQMYKRLMDVNNYEELKDFRDKKLIPVAVFYDIPFISGPLYENYIVPVLEELEKDYPGIKNFKCYLMSIEELENYRYISTETSIEEILEIVKSDRQKSFNSEVQRIYKENPTGETSLLDRSFDEFCKSVIGS